MTRTIPTPAALAVTLALSAIQRSRSSGRPAPTGSPAPQVRGKYAGGGDEPRYEGG